MVADSRAVEEAAAEVATVEAWEVQWAAKKVVEALVESEAVVARCSIQHSQHNS